jgi:hypothetical protein
MLAFLSIANRESYVRTLVLLQTQTYEAASNVNGSKGFTTELALQHNYEHIHLT